jgi:CBS domain-containing protein
MIAAECFVSGLLGRPAAVEGGGARTPIGTIADFLVRNPSDSFPRIDGVIVKTKDGRRFAPLEQIEQLDAHGGLVLREAPSEPAVPHEQALYLIADLFDKQIVDVNGRKVVRINDLEIAYAAGSLRVVAADIGLSGLLRRLGADRVIPAPLFEKIPRALIAWDNVAPIQDVNPSRIELAVSGRRLARLHPFDLAGIISELSAKDAARVITSLDDETAADALEHLDSDVQRRVIEDLGTERAADIIEEMDSDDAADLLGDLPEEKQTELLASMEPEAAGELRDLVKYADDTAGGMMTTDYVWIYPHRTVAATIAKLREIAPETEFIYYLYVTDQAEKLLGALSLRTLLLSSPEATIHSLMDRDLVTVTADTAAQDVAATIARYDLLACPVVDDGGKMLGIVTVDDAIDALLPERIAKQLPRFVSHHQHGDLHRAGTA